MKAYCISKLNIRQWEESTGNIFNFEKFVHGKDSGNIREIGRDEDNDDFLLLNFLETTNIEVSKFNEDNGEIYNEEIEGYFLKISCCIIPRINDGLLITNISGLGIVLRGLGGRRYIDNVVGPLISKHILGESHYYSPFSFVEKKMKWDLWGEELRGIIVDIPGIGRSNFSGQNLSSKKVGDKNISLMDIISYGNVRRFNVFNKSIGRIIGVNKNGTFYSSHKISDVASFIIKLQKLVF